MHVFFYLNPQMKICVLIVVQKNSSGLSVYATKKTLCWLVFCYSKLQNNHVKKDGRQKNRAKKAMKNKIAVHKKRREHVQKNVQ